MVSEDVRVVISLHGIRTRGVWQKDLAPELARVGFIPYALDYGAFGALQLLRASNLDAKADWLVREYDRIRADTGCVRPNVVAHSFGTLQVAHLMRKYDSVVFDKVILAAGIVPLDFPWSHMLDAQRVNWVVNDYGGRDVWPKLARLFVPNAGDSGTARFEKTHRALHQVWHPHHRHSDYFSQGNFRGSWVPTLLLDKRAIIDKLHALIGILAQALTLRRDRLRGFVLQVDPAGAGLKVVPGLHLGDMAPREVDLSIPLDARGPGAAPALAYSELREVRQTAAELAALRESYDGDSPLHADLKWSVALPLPVGPDFTEAEGVLIIDGLEEPSDGALADELFEEENVFNILIQMGDALMQGRAAPVLG
jgi:pimeloyl-ACP methyl ester carboxylesterase